MTLLFFLQRLFSARHLKGSVRIMRIIAIAGVAIAVATLVLVTSSASGFRKSYRKAILDFNAHLVVMDAQGILNVDATIDKLTEFSQTLKNDHKIVGLTPFLYEEVLIAGKGGIRGVVVKGVDPDTVGDVNKMEMSLNAKDLKTAFASNSIPLVLGETLASDLDVKVGGDVRIFLPTDEDFKVGKVVGTFKSGLHDYDAKFMLVPIDLCLKLFGLPKGSSAGIEMRLQDPDKAGVVASQISDRFPEIEEPITWYELNRDLFAAVKLEGIVSAILVGTLVIAASLNIITVLVLFVIFRRTEIAILAATGASPRFRRRLFELGGVLMGFEGTLIGLIVGVIAGLIIGKSGLIRLPADIYFISELPVDLSVYVCGIIGIFSVIICWFGAFIAARRASRMELSEALKAPK